MESWSTVDSTRQLLVAEVAAGDVRTERQRQAGLQQPPLAEVEHLLQPLVGIRQLTLVDDEADVGVARLHLVEDLVERHLPVTEVADRHAEHEERRRHASGHRDLEVGEVVQRERLARNDDGAVAGAHARAVRQEDVAVLNEGVGVKGDRRRLQAPFERPLVQRLDVAEHMLELEAARVDAAGGKPPEHEGVVGVRAVSEADPHEALDPSSL